MVGPLRGPHSSKKQKKRGGVRRTRGDVEPCCLRSMSCGSLTQPRLANTTVPVFCRWVACHRRLCNSIYFSRRCYNRAVILLWHYCQAAYDLKQKKEDEEKNMRKDWKEVTCLLSVLPDTKTWCLTPFSLVDYLLTYVALHTRCQLRCMN